MIKITNNDILNIVGCFRQIKTSPVFGSIEAIFSIKNIFDRLKFNTDHYVTAFRDQSIVSLVELYFKEEKIKYEEQIDYRIIHRLYNYQGYSILLRKYEDEDRKWEILVRIDEYDKAVDSMHKLIKNHLPSIANLSLKTKSIKNIEIKNINTEVIRNLVSEISIFNLSKFNRSYLFLGVPGTGKTSSAINIAAKLNYRTIILKPEENSNINELMDMINALSIECLIIDDFDKTNYTNIQFIGMLDKLKESLKLFIVTCNEIDMFDPSFIRSGRIDKIVEFSPDQELNKQILGEFYDKVDSKEWTIADALEYKNRVSLLGEDKANELLEEIRIRKEHLKKWEEKSKTPVFMLQNNNNDEND